MRYGTLSSMAFKAFLPFPGFARMISSNRLSITWDGAPQQPPESDVTISARQHRRKRLST